MIWSDQILSFYRSLRFEEKLPKGIEAMNPYKDNYIFSLCETFYRKYYHDDKQRFLIFGINPGRFGSGITGISFTDPIKLEKECGIENTLTKKPELSADFIYAMIHQYGGLMDFYSKFFITSLSPLGFISEGKNVNYYDDLKLQKIVLPFVTKSISTVASWNVSHKKCFCLGEGKNFNFLKLLNEKHQWFEEVIPLSHPRFIMQYKRKQLAHYINDYLSKLKN